MLTLTRARRNRIILWLALALLVGGMIYVARRVLLPYILGLILAYVLLPVVNWLERHLPQRLRAWRMARPLAILIVYLLLAGLLAGIVAFAVPLVSQQVRSLVDNWPKLSGRVQDWGIRGWDWYQQAVPDSWRGTVEANLTSLLNDVVTAVRNATLSTLRTAFSTISFVIGLVVIPFWLFYILHDESRVKRGVIGALPSQLQADVLCLASLIDDVLSAYLRGQLLLCLFVGSMATVSLLIIGVPFAFVLGLIAGFFEILPFIGPILGGIPAVLVALLIDPILALWVVVSFSAIQQVENLILVPRIAGKSVRLHPALVMVVLVIGNEMAGFWGMLLAVPATAVIRDVFKYLYLRLIDEPMEPEKAMSHIRSGEEFALGV